MKFALPLALLFFAVSLAPASAAGTIADAKSAAEGASVTLAGKIATSSYGEIGGQIYIEEPDRSAGIQAYIGASALSNVTEGKSVTVTGNLYTTSTGERILNNAVFSSVGTSASPLVPLGLKNATIGGTGFSLQKGVKNGQGLNNVGLLVKTCGRVKSADSSTASVDDGSKSTVLVDISRLATKPNKDDFLSVTGLVSLQLSGGDIVPIIRPRRQGDVRTFSTKALEQIQNTQVGPGQVGIFWIGVGGFVLKDSQGHKVAIDPYLSDYVRQMQDSRFVRLQPVPIPPEMLQADLMLLTHDHGDHTDPWTIKPFYQSHPSCTFWGPTASYNHLALSDCGYIPAAQRATIGRGTTLTWAGTGITVKGIYANHDAAKPGVGFLITMAGKRIYISGDTIYDSTLVSDVTANKADIAIVCVNGLWGNMGGSDAAKVVKASGASYAIPMHYGMFSINTDPAAPQSFVDGCRSQGVTAQVIVLPTFGYVVL